MTSPDEPSHRRARGPYAKTPAHRARIIDAAAMEFSHIGFAKASMNGIALRAGMSRAGVLHHFPTKDAVLTAVLERADAVIDEYMTGREGVEAIRGLIELVGSTTGLPRLIQLHASLSAEAVLPDHPAHAHFARRFAAVGSLLDQAFAHLTREGRATTSLPNEQIARETIALVEGLQMQWLRGAAHIDVGEVVRRYVTRYFDVDL